MIIGIDPGVSGAIAFMYDHGVPEIHDMPTKEAGETRREVDPEALWELIEAQPRRGEAIGSAWIEQVFVTPAFAQYGATIVKAAAVAEVVATLLNWRVRYVQTRTWMKATAIEVETVDADGEKMSADRKKLNRRKATLEKARMLYPMLGERLAREKDHDRAAALLIADYGRRYEAGVVR